VVVVVVVVGRENPVHQQEPFWFLSSSWGRVRVRNEGVLFGKCVGVLIILWFGGALSKWRKNTFCALDSFDTLVF